MTATPIPRTLAMIAYADLDTSIIDELPPGRKPITTVAIPNTRRDEIIERVQSACTEGQQVYWVCTLIDESEKIQCRAAEDTFNHLKEALAHLEIDLVHGRMKSDEKDNAMNLFKEGVTRLLVATTVIEVGVDVPNASLMIIENAERLGLAQLHQLRGRVGRGEAASKCVLLYQAPLTETAKTRLGVMRESNDGFKIAQKDLEIRGPGEVLGTRQAGSIQFRVANLARDNAQINTISTKAEWILNKHPEVIAPLVARWLGDSSKYGEV